MQGCDALVCNEGFKLLGMQQLNGQGETIASGTVLQNNFYSDYLSYDSPAMEVRKLWISAADDPPEFDDATSTIKLGDANNDRPPNLCCALCQSEKPPSRSVAETYCLDRW